MTLPDFDESKWIEIIRRPDWYVEYAQLAERAKKELSEDKLDELNKQARHFFEAALLGDKVRVATEGPDFDAERQRIDTVVIHHTSAKPGYRLSYLNAVHLLNIYAPAFAEPEYLGHPIWSGHFSGGKQVFWGYHWLMRMDGTFEKLLDDGKIGWHAGNWPINKRSIGICLDNDYEHQDPTDGLLQKLATHIRRNYPRVKVIGHREARQGTICPGGNFLEGWKPKLLKYLADGP
jgi:hypothetical protein